MIALSNPFISRFAAHSLAFSLMFCGIGGFVLCLGIIDAVKRRRKYLNRRQEIMHLGYLSKGKIINAKTKISSVTEYTGHRDKNNQRESYHHWDVNHCLEVEYYDEQAGIYKRFMAQGMNKNAKIHRMIGKEVEVYNYDGFIYINIP